MVGRLIVLAFFHFFFLSLSLSQAKRIEGRIVDANTKTGISGASVYILNTNNAIIEYVYTDKNGDFTVEKERKSAEAAGQNIEFSFLGYETQRRVLRDFTPGTVVELLPADLPLPEVKIVSHPIKEQGDTLVYSVARFKMAQDRSIADVLRNMPGIKVADDGSIYYQGEPINKFYIEGVDLLNDKYKIASNNLRADYVQDVQILQQHEPVKSLRGKTFGEQAAINLVLGENAKQRWLFSVDTGVGLPLALWDNRLMAMSFGRISQNLSMYKNNNTGEDIASELSSPATVAEIVREFRIPDEEKGLFQSDATSVLPLDKKKYRFNASHLATSNHVRKFSEDKDIRFQISYFNDRENRQSDSKQTYLLDGDSVPVIQESKVNAGCRHKLQGELSYTHNADNFYLRNKLSSILLREEQDNRYGVSGYDAEERFNMPQQSVRNDFRIVVPRKRGRWEASSLTQVAMLSHDAAFLLEDEAKAYPYAQEYRLKNSVTSNSISYAGQRNKYQIKSSMGFDFTSQALTSLLLSPELIDVPDCENDVVLKNMSSYAEMQIGSKSDKIDYYLILLAKHTSVKINGADSVGSTHLFFRFLPSAGIKFYPSNWLTLSLKGQLTDDIADIRALFPQTIFINYRSLKSFTATPTRDLSQKYVLSLAYRNPVNVFFMEGYVGYSVTESRVMNESFFIDDLFQRSATRFSANRRRSPVLGISVSKMFAWWNTKIFMDGFYSGRGYSYILQSRQVDFFNKSYTVDVRVSIRPTNRFNNEYELKYVHSTLDGRGGMGDFSASYYQHTLSTHFIPYSNVQVGITQDLYRTKKANCYFADFEVLYRFKAVDVGMQIKNITNRNEYIFENVGDFYESLTIHRMRPRELLIKASLNF